jgi:hypothetical protein
MHCPGADGINATLGQLFVSAWSTSAQNVIQYSQPFPSSFGGEPPDALYIVVLSFSEPFRAVSDVVVVHL